jgi:hypothetical protein
MDIEEFYDENPARRASEEAEFGREWTDAAGNHAEVSWVHDTGELYLMTAPIEPIFASGLPGQEDVKPLPTDAVIVDILGVFPTIEAVEAALAGWPKAMPQPNSVEWVRDHVAHVGSGAPGDIPPDEAPTEIPGAHPDS